MDDRRPLLAIAAAVCASLAAWLSLGTLTLLSAGPSAERVGVLPPWWVLVLLLVGAVGVALAARPRRGVVLPWFLTAVLVLPWLPLPLPTAVLAASGPLTILVWTAVLAAAASAVEWRGGVQAPDRGAAGRRGPFLAGLVAFVVYAGASWQMTAVLPGGDEPHYLIITQSLLADHDLKIENNHRQADYQSYFGGVLKPDFLRRGQDRQIYSIHLPGVSVLVAPAFALGGYEAVRLWLGLLAALAVGLTWWMAFRLTSSAGAAWVGTIGAALTAPFLLLAFTVYPDGPGGIVVAAAFALLATCPPGEARRMRWWAGAGALAAVLPWLHPRFAVLAACLAVVFGLRAWRMTDRWRALAAFAAVPVASALTWFGYYFVIYGSPNPSVAYGHYTQMSVSNAVRGVPGLLFDQQFGLLATSPVWALAFTGLLPMFRHHRRLAIECLAIVVPYAVVTAMYHMWWGGQSSPARFLGPVMLIGAAPMALQWRWGRSHVDRAWQVMLLAVSLALAGVLVAAEHGRFAFSFRDGFAPWAVWASTLADVARAQPSWFRASWPVGLWEACVWVALLATAWAASRWTASRRTRSRGGAAIVAGTCFLAAAMLAATMTWRMEGASGLAPTAGQLAVIRELASRASATTVAYGPLQFTEGAALVRRMRLGGERPPGAPGDAWLWLPNLPAGRYELRLDNRRAGASFDAAVSIGRSPTPIAVWPLRDARPGPQAFAVTLPVDVHSLVVRGAEEARGQFRGLWLQPQSIGPEREGMSGLRATAARRYGDDLIVWAASEGVYLEDAGLWISAETDADLVLEWPAGHTDPVMAVRAGAAGVRATVAFGNLVSTVALAAGERQALRVPLPATGVVRVRVRTDTGFRPAQVDSSSTDDRYLGVWIDFP